MKKNGKKYRAMRKLKEQNKIKELEKQEKYPPFYKASKKRLECRHYSVVFGLDYVGRGKTFLQEYSDKLCKCKVCKKMFPVEALEKSKMYVMYLASHGIGFAHLGMDVDSVKEFPKLFPPVYYYRVSGNEIVYDKEYSLHESFPDAELKNSMIYESLRQNE